MIEHETLAALGQYGPWVAVIGLLLRANAQKDRIISELSSKAMQMAQANQQMAQATRQVVQIVKDQA